MKDEFEEDSKLTIEQQKFVDTLSDEDLEIIDQALLKNVDGHYYRKVARIVGATMSCLKGKYKGVPDVFFAQRIRRLAGNGMLQSQGNLKGMRYSEVKLPTSDEE